jgi:activator of Hsp90 ATPase-like protein
MTIAPIRHAVHTKAPPAKAFEIFTGQIGRWWPKGNGVGAKPLVEVVLEPGVGGRWFERDADGCETQWGRVLVWRPPGTLVLAWQLNREKCFDPDLVTEVELSFTAASDGGTDVALEHRNLERFGQDAVQWLASVGGGWSQKLGEFAAFADLPDQEE